jgi:hypothetical protein
MLNKGQLQMQLPFISINTINRPTIMPYYCLLFYEQDLSIPEHTKNASQSGAGMGFLF